MGQFSARAVRHPAQGRGSRLPRPTSTLNFKDKTPAWRTDLNRIRRRVARGGKVTLYRARPVRNVYRKGRKGMRRTLNVTRGQSWTTSPRLALQFALFRATYRPGEAGLLYSITVPADEMRGIGADAIQHSSYYDTRLSRSTGNRGEWTAMRDQGPLQGRDQKWRDGLEIRPNRDRPDLKPKIVGTAVRQSDGETIRYGLARRLNRQRGAAIRGGGA